jgi:hypothetical protein
MDEGLEIRCDEEGFWIATATVPSDPDTWIVTSGPRESVEAACAEVISRFSLAGHEVK